MKSIRCAIVAGALALGLGSSAWAAPLYGYYSQPLSSLEGGSTLVITNCTGNIGNGSDITNVLFGSTATTSIQGQGTNWIAVVIPATNAPADVIIKTSSQSAGQLSVFPITTETGDNTFHYLIKAIEGNPLMLGVSSTNGWIKVYRKFGANTIYTREYFGQFPSYLQLVNGTTTNRFSGVFTAVSNNMPDSGTINFVMDAGNTGVRITQVLRYVNGKNYFTKQWRIANMGATGYTDVRFIHGGDTYFANSDSACGYYNADLDMVYLKNTNAAGLMGFYGGYNSRSDRYYAGDLTTMYGGLANYCLSNSVNTNFTDAGYALQWNTNSLAAGTERTITAYEKWTDAGDVQVIAAADLSGSLNASVTGLFTVVNFQTNADVFGLSAGVNQPGWTASVLGGTNLTLASGASSNVLIQVTIGSRAPCGVTLTAASQTIPSVTNSDSLTVSGPARIEQTIGDFTPTNRASFLPGDTAVLAATASSGLTVGFTNSAGSAVGWLNATTIIFAATGTVNIVASQAGDEDYNAAPSVTNTFTVLPGPAGAGSLAVIIRPADAVAAGATWRVDGGAWQVSETIVTELAAGIHTVSYSIVPGYTNPADQNVVILPNQLTAVEGTYQLNSGDAGYKPVCADYDGDRLADPAVFRPADGLWLARFSGIGYQWGRMGRAFGSGGYAPVAADFDGDRLADPGLYNTASGEWRAMFSNIGYTEDFVANLLGGTGSTALAADFDGDAKADPTVYNPTTGSWETKLSSGGYLTFAFSDLLGQTGFAAAGGDVDGDRLADPFVCDMATGQCVALLSSAGYYRIETGAGFLGAPAWLLALADYDGDGLADPAIYDPESGTLAIRFSAAGYQPVILPEFLKP